MQLVDLLKIFWVSLAASAIVAWPIYRWLKRTVKQKIDPYAPEGHQVKQGTPTMGGLIILVGAAVGLYFGSSLLSDNWNGLDAVALGLSRAQLTSFLILMVGFGLIGFVDDFVVPRLYKAKRGLGWKQKFLLEAVIASTACYFGHVALLDWQPIAVGAFLILFFSNAYNFSDGLDGLAGSLWCGLSVGILLVVGFDHGAAQMATVAVLGGVVVFLFLNAPPAKVFMGDVGSLPLGAVLGFSVYTMLFSYNSSRSPSLRMETEYLVPLAMLSFVMIAELVPVPMQVAYFKLTKGKRLFPMTPIHHAFEKKGWKETKVVWTFALTQLLLSLGAASVYLAINGVKR